eukprot:tig00001537_g9302.t1
MAVLFSAAVLASPSAALGVPALASPSSERFCRHFKPVSAAANVPGPEVPRADILPPATRSWRSGRAISARRAFVGLEGPSWSARHSSRELPSPASAAFVGSHSAGEGKPAPPAPPAGEREEGGEFGTVYLVGAGPGDAGLMTLKGKALLEAADCVLTDHLVSPDILAMANPDAEVVHVGKQRDHHTVPQQDLNWLLVEKARQHRRVVRLKGGDPFVFGRGAEEMAVLVEAGVPCEVVPGVTAGIAAPAYAGIPVTHREAASSVTFVTGHEVVDKRRRAVDWAAIARGSETIVIYMGMHNLAEIVAQLAGGGGLAAETPVAVIRWGTWARQEELVADLGSVVARVQEAGFGAPAIAVIGAVVALRPSLTQTRATALPAPPAVLP